MGLSIYYRARVKTDADGARTAVRALHAAVSQLPFDSVSPVYEFDPPDGRYDFTRGDDEPCPWKPGDLYLTRKRADGERELVHVPALHVVCFHAKVPGSESPAFGLACHPPVVLHREDVITESPDGGELRELGAGPVIEFPTRRRGWYSWQAATKTQYASNPKHGGVANFLRAHVSIFRAIDEMANLGVKTRIRDDGGYWRRRSESDLVAELTKWDELVAGFAGQLSDALGDVIAPIKERPDYEHLEAKGADRLRKPRPDDRT